MPVLDDVRLYKRQWIQQGRLSESLPIMEVSSPQAIQLVKIFRSMMFMSPVLQPPAMREAMRACEFSAVSLRYVIERITFYGVGFKLRVEQ